MKNVSTGHTYGIRFGNGELFIPIPEVAMSLEGGLFISDIINLSEQQLIFCEKNTILCQRLLFHKFIPNNNFIYYNLFSIKKTKNLRYLWN